MYINWFFPLPGSPIPQSNIFTISEWWKKKFFFDRSGYVFYPLTYFVLFCAFFRTFLTHLMEISKSSPTFSRIGCPSTIIRWVFAPKRRFFSKSFAKKARIWVFWVWFSIFEYFLKFLTKMLLIKLKYR